MRLEAGRSTYLGDSWKELAALASWDGEFPFEEVGHDCLTRLYEHGRWWRHWESHRPGIARLRELISAGRVPYVLTRDRFGCAVDCGADLRYTECPPHHPPMSFGDDAEVLCRLVSKLLRDGTIRREGLPESYWELVEREYVPRLRVRHRFQRLHSYAYQVRLGPEGGEVAYLFRCELNTSLDRYFRDLLTSLGLHLHHLYMGPASVPEFSVMRMVADDWELATGTASSAMVLTSSGRDVWRGSPAKTDSLFLADLDLRGDNPVLQYVRSRVPLAGG